MMQEGLAALLEHDAGVSAIVAGRIFAIQAPPQGEVYPCLVYKCVGGEGAAIFEDGAGPIRQRIEVTAYSADCSEAMRLRYAATVALKGWRHETLSDGTRIDTCNLLNPGLDIEPGGTRYFSCMCEFYVFFDMPI
jgi:hypothetical protein